MGIAVVQSSWTGVGIGIGFCVSGVVVLRGILGCLVLQLLACIVMSSGA
jgi:hypothetical protein